MDNINQKINAYLEALVLGILADPSLQNLNPQEKQDYAQKLRDHFSNLMLETAFNRMSNEQIADLKANLQNPQELDKKIEDYSSQIPGLAEDIEIRLQKEFDVMKMSLSKVQG